MKGSFIKLGKKSGQLEQINTCAPCHARISEISPKHIESKEIMDNYIPQIPDTEYYHADGQVDDEDYIYTSFLQSKMFSKGIKCSNCHNPHSTKLKLTGNQTCIQCHIATKYDTPKHTFHAMGTKGASCVNCHMPGKLYMGSITTQTSLNTLLSCLNHTDAQVRYRALRSLSHFPTTSWTEAVAPLLSDKVRAVRIAAADLYITIPKDQIPSQHTSAFETANKELVSYLRYQTDFSVGNIMLADYYLKMQDYANAESFYLKGLKKDSQMNYAYLNLSSLYNAVGKNDASLQVLQKALKNDPNNERIYYNMALLYNEMNNKTAAEKSFAKAVELKSQNPRVYYNYGLMLNANKKFKEAEAIFLKGIAINPGAPDLYYGLTFVYIQTGNSIKAQQTAYQLKQLDPSNPNYQELFKNLGVQ